MTYEVSKVFWLLNIFLLFALSYTPQHWSNLKIQYLDWEIIAQRIKCLSGRAGKGKVFWDRLEEVGDREEEEEEEEEADLTVPYHAGSSQCILGSCH